MVGSDQRTLLNVFIASPGDLNQERERFRNVLGEVNTLKAHSLGLHLEPLGWEDTVPGKGRPQALINADIERADLFVLALWTRWGTPSGAYSSGTEEEFELARQLHQAVGKPEMWVYFKDVPPAMRADPGEQLQKVLAFRQRIQDERSFLYRTFIDSDDWTSQLKLHLARWLDPKGSLARPVRRAPMTAAERTILHVGVCEAITERALVSFTYDGGTRIVEPHCHGYSTRGKEVLRAFQISGVSRSGNPVDWKLFEVDKIKDLEDVGSTFGKNRLGYNPHDRGMRSICCCV